MYEYVYPKVFEGKTDEEIIEICKKYLGECDVEHRYFPNALSNGNALFSYGDRLWSISHNLNNNYVPLEKSEKRDLGVSGSPGAPLQHLAIKALEEEALKVSQMGLKCENKNEMISSEEIERRVSLLHDCCTPQLMEYFVNNSIYRWVYAEPIEEIEANFARSNSNLANSLQNSLPQFFKMIEVFLEYNVDLEGIKMKNGQSLLEAYNSIKEKYNKYIIDGEIIDPSEAENVQEEVKEEQKDDMTQMIDDTTDKDLSPEAIQKMIEENNRTISELMAQNSKLMEQLMKSMDKGKQQTL